MRPSLRLRLLLGALAASLLGFTFLGIGYFTDQLVLGAIAGAAAVFGISLVAVSLVIEPINGLARAALLVSSGLRGVRIPEKGAPELVTLIRQLNRLAAEVDEAERRQADFVAAAAHELITPLSNVRGLLIGLQEGSMPDDPTVLQMMQSEAEGMLRTVQSLLTLAESERSGRGTDTRTPVSIEAVIRAAVAEVATGLGTHDHEVVIQATRNLTVMADERSLVRILVNLLENAIWHGDAGGPIWVATEATEMDAIVAVSNTGEALDPDAGDRLFDRFYRMDPSRDRATGGAGLGLAVVRRLVEGGGGRVGVDSEDGRNRFWFTVPLAQLES